MNRRAQQPSKFVLSCLDAIGPRIDAMALDAPCGFGRHAIDLTNRDYVVTALDIDPGRVAVVVDELLQSRANGSTAAVADLERIDSVPTRAFDVALVVDYASEAGLRAVVAGVRPGGFIVIETFRANGENWRSLPSPGHLRMLLASDFEVFRYEERPTGPTRTEAVSVRCFGRRHEPESRLG